MKNNVLMVFLKYPQPGYVKTRLAESVGHDKAALVYKRIAQRLLEQIKSDDYDILLFCDPRTKEERYKEWLDVPEINLQQGADLGARMHRAFLDVFSRGYEKAMIIGSDCLQITSDDVLQAFTCLEKKQVVVGPTKDGGYYLIALKKPFPFLFQGIVWGAETVFQKTHDILSCEGISHEYLSVKADIDRYEDLIHEKLEILLKPEKISVEELR